MPRTETDTAILIVGAGPVGLFLANECARRGLSWRIVETRATQSVHSKALAIFPRTMEIFDMAGIVKPFLEKANRVTSVRVTTHGRTLAHMAFTPMESPYRFVAMVPQNLTEQLLVEELKSKGGKVEYETSFVSAVQADDRVTATLDHKGEQFDVTCKFLIGCDGAHSTIRHLLNLPFEGAQYDDSFVLADIETNETLPRDELQLCPHENGPVAIFPISATRRRIIASVKVLEGDAPSLDLIRRIMLERAPKEVEARSLHWSTYFRIHHRQVGQLRVGRIFIAGDAAHIHSPFGGQGMNTGLHDVWNLVWKLDLVLNGLGSAQLLDSYNSERRPVIQQVIRTTHLLTKALGTPNKLAQLLRDTVIPMVSRLAPFQHAFVERLSELGINYDGSPIVDESGERYFDDSLRGGRGIKSKFLLVMPGEAKANGDAQRIAEEFSDIVDVRQADVEELLLVRPDGYISFSSEKCNEEVFQKVRELLGKQTNASTTPLSAAQAL